MTPTVEDALSRFALIAGQGDGETTVCAMTAISWIAGEAWTDRPECAHHVIASNVIRVNDHAETTMEMRAEIVKAGATGIIDTWWIPTEVVAWAFSGERGEAINGFDRLMRALTRISEWKVTKHRADLTGADLTRADLTRADLTRAYLTGANLTRADLTRAYLTGADLTRAYLTGANLTRANLTGAYRPVNPPDGWEPNSEGLLVRKEAM